MLEPDAATAALALERQGAALAALLARLEHVRSYVLPLAPSRQWIGPAQTAYESRLRELTALMDDSIGTVRLARSCTADAIVRVAGSVG